MSKDSIPYLTIDPAIEEQIRTDREAGRMSPYRFRDETWPGGSPTLTT